MPMFVRVLQFMLAVKVFKKDKGRVEVVTKEWARKPSFESCSLFIFFYSNFKLSLMLLNIII
jgi:hypothetical protein